MVFKKGVYQGYGFKKGNVPYNKGKPNPSAKNLPQTFRKGNITWNTGMKGLTNAGTFKEGHKLYLGIEKGWFKREHKPWNTGIIWEEMRGEKHPNWQNGKSFEPYGKEFNEQLKEQIRRRDGYRCQECFRHQNELQRKLDVHHIDFNKKNNSPENLISLCNQCHLQTNYDRNEWTEYFQQAQLQRGGVC